VVRHAAGLGGGDGGGDRLGFTHFAFKRGESTSFRGGKKQMIIAKKEGGRGAKGELQGNSSTWVGEAKGAFEGSTQRKEKFFNLGRGKRKGG